MRDDTVDIDGLISAFEGCEITTENFRHPDHVRMAWCYLNRWPVLEAVDRFSAALRRFATFHGKPDLYHETVTWAYLFLIHERMGRMEPDRGWEEFAAANADLLRWRDGVLRSYYSEACLESELARRLFVLPDAGLRDAGRCADGPEQADRRPELPASPAHAAVEGR